MRRGRIGRPSKGQFPIKPGMIFTMPDMDELHPRGFEIKAGKHPWLVLSEDADSVEVVMCHTIQSKTDNKFRFHRYLNYDNVAKIDNPCPPMEPSSDRISGCKLDTYMILPKSQLFDHNLQLWNDSSEERNFTTEGYQSLCLDEHDVNRIRNKSLDYSFTYHTPGELTDPTGYLKASEAMYEYLQKKRKQSGLHSRKFFTGRLSEKIRLAALTSHQNGTTSSKGTQSPSMGIG